MKKTILAAMIAATPLTAAPVFGDPPPWAPAHGRRHHDRDYRQTSNGTVGLLVGAALGALIGRSIDTHGERVTGTVLGAAGGALVGNELAKGRTRCRLHLT